ncbi:MAG: hypothetical protein ACRCZZ_08245 [Phocaeicola sp.]
MQYYSINNLSEFKEFSHNLYAEIERFGLNISMKNFSKVSRHRGESDHFVKVSFSYQGIGFTYLLESDVVEVHSLGTRGAGGPIQMGDLQTICLVLKDFGSALY